MDTNNSFLQAIKILIKESVNSAPYNRTKQAMIVSNNGDNTYDIRFDGKLYTNIISYPNTRSLPLKHIVKVIIPNNQASQMYISAEGSPLIYYPIGSYYETSDSAFNPNNEWGGTWELEAEGLVHIGAGSNYIIGATGGEETHLLTAAESGVPAHNHTMSHTHGTGNDTYTNFVTASGDIANDTASALSGSGYKVPHIVESLAFNQETIISDSSNSNTGNNTASDATTAHNNMQPYTVVNRWHRTA